MTSKIASLIFQWKNAASRSELRACVSLGAISNTILSSTIKRGRRRRPREKREVPPDTYRVADININIAVLAVTGDSRV